MIVFAAFFLVLASTCGVVAIRFALRQRRSLGIFFGGVAVGLCFGTWVFVLVQSNLRTYAPLPLDEDIALIGVSEVRGGLYDLDVEWLGDPLASATDPGQRLFEAEGDVWRVSGQLLTPKAWAKPLVGAAPLYRLQSVSSLAMARDDTFEEPLDLPRSTPPVLWTQPAGTEMWFRSRGRLKWFSPWRATRPDTRLEGPMTDGGVYAIALDDRGQFYVRSMNDAGQRALDAFFEVGP